MMSFALARLSYCQQIVEPDHGASELRFQISLAMKRLYDKGCRRFRAVPLSPDGDAIKYMVMGWPR